jgi:hypothetical protein
MYYYQDYQLIQQAWELPQASNFKTHWPIYQLTEGCCGPATYNNIMASLGKPLIKQKIGPMDLEQMKLMIKKTGMKVTEIVNYSY